MILDLLIPFNFSCKPVTLLIGCDYRHDEPAMEYACNRALQFSKLVTTREKQIAYCSNHWGNKCY